ncbi:Hypothetical protein NTJ_12438 [Nesidiocoris tenuis]|uniref:Uncharacterized protein n=1 Tax=Nesidiocoris tenuis TaxID=355587 RepID=A0ABN7B5D2_9HEMI|nr:Hypothetical protein NTJ_12438 [Nesidiocoris tenuis]
MWEQTIQTPQNKTRRPGESATIAFQGPEGSQLIDTQSYPGEISKGPLRSSITVIDTPASMRPKRIRVSLAQLGLSISHSLPPNIHPGEP